MAHVDPKQQIMLRLAAITAADAAFVFWLVRSAIRSGIAPDNSGFRRDEKPFAFWASIVLVIAAGVAFAAALGYAVLTP